MKNTVTVLILIVLSVLFVSCDTKPQIKNPMEKEIDGGMQIRTVTLKYALLDSLYEIYQANVLSVDNYGLYYSNGTQRELDHYDWLIKTYGSFTLQNRADLNTIFDEIHIWKLLDIMTLTADNTQIQELMTVIETSGEIPQKAKNALLKIVPEFYDLFLKDYLNNNTDYYNTKSSEFNIKLKNYPNPFKILESQTKINLGDYSPLFYLTFRKVGAYGFTYGNLKISTIQGNVEKVEHIMSTALHEFSHGFFQKFTKEAEFKKLSDRLKTVDEFYNYWNSQPSLLNSYSWTAFCEENLVEGFAKFLGYKFYNIEYRAETYIYDIDFFEYLLSIDYSPEKDDFKGVSFDFYETLLEEYGI